MSRIVRALRRLAGAAGTPASPYARLAPLDTPHLVRIPPLRAVEVTDAAPRLTVLLPALRSGSLTGGPNTALNLAGRLVGEGIRVRFASTFESADPDPRPLRDQIATLTGSPSLADRVELADATVDGLAIEPTEVLMATWWPTAHVARAALALTRAREFIYLIQDYEPGFYAWSTNFALAEATYRFAHRAIFNERVLEASFQDQPAGGRGASIAFEPALDRTRFHPPAPGERSGPHRLLFYARPQADRNAFELGLRALRLAAANGAFASGDWTAGSVGAPLPDLALGGGLVLRNRPWLDLDAWAAELRRSSVLVSLMISPHTSYPPLEMAACGGLVVTNTFASKTAGFLAGLSPRIVGVAPEPEALAAAVADAVRRVEDAGGAGAIGAGAIGAGDALTTLPGSWDEAFREVVPWLAAAVRELSGRA